MSTKKSELATKVQKGFCLSSLAVDKEKAKTGIWFPFMNGVELLICRSGSLPERQALANLYKANQAAIDSDTPEGNELAEQLTIQVEAQYRLVGWRGVVDAEGNEEPYTVEKSIEYMGIEEVRSFVNGKATSYEPWRVSSTVAEKLKN